MHNGHDLRPTYIRLPGALKQLAIKKARSRGITLAELIRESLAANIGWEEPGRQLNFEDLTRLSKKPGELDLVLDTDLDLYQVRYPEGEAS